MPCEIEMLISSKLSEYPVEFKLCKNKIASTLKLLINKSNPEIYFKHEKFKFIKGNIIVRISGKFSNNNKADNNDTNGIGFLIMAIFCLISTFLVYFRGYILK